MAFAKRSWLRKPRLRALIVLVAPEITALTMPQRCSRTMRAAWTTGPRRQRNAQLSHRFHPAIAQLRLL